MFWTEPTSHASTVSIVSLPSARVQKKRIQVPSERETAPSHVLMPPHSLDDCLSAEHSRPHVGVPCSRFDFGFRRSSHVLQLGASRRLRCTPGQASASSHLRAAIEGSGTTSGFLCSSLHTDLHNKTTQKKVENVTEWKYKIPVSCGEDHADSHHTTADFQASPMQEAGRV